MALVVEDGTGLPNADSYVSLPSANEYHLAQGNAAWAAASESNREVALRRATGYVDNRYMAARLQYRGVPVSPVQALEWPRTCFPWPVRRVVAATCELALRALPGPLYADVQPDGRIKSETIGPLETVYADAVNGGQVRYAVADDMLAPLLAERSQTVRMLRG